MDLELLMRPTPINSKRDAIEEKELRSHTDEHFLVILSLSGAYRVEYSARTS